MKYKLRDNIEGVIITSDDHKAIDIEKTSRIDTYREQGYDLKLNIEEDGTFIIGQK